MARFYGMVQGNRSPATRMGTPSSGIEGHIRGWDVGISVICYVDPKYDKDVCEAWLTGGSNNPSRKELLARRGEGGRKEDDF